MLTWPFDPTVYAGLIALVAGHYLLSRDLPDVRPMHRLWFGAGVLTLWIGLETSIDTISDGYLDSVHMLQHVLIGFVAPPLMLLGLSSGMVGRLVKAPGVRIATEPVPAQLAAGVVMIAWHLPALYEATLYNEWIHVVEHVSFIAGGLVLFWPVLEATSAHSRHRMSPAAKLVYLAIATLPQDGVALALIFSRVSFYEYYTHVPRLITGFTPVIDQTIAGAVLMVFGKFTMAVAALAVFFRWFGHEQGADLGRESPTAVSH